MQSGFSLARREAATEPAAHALEAWGTLTALERLTAGLLAGMVLLWTTFQVVEIRALFPPIGIVYALGSIAVAGATLHSWRRWSPSLAAGWTAVTMIPESIPAISHLLDWTEIYTHFGHYLLIMTFFPLAITLVAAGVGATVQNYRRERQDRRAPNWLRSALLGVAAVILVGNAVTLVLHAYKVP
ncbi:MAG: hypothetical protein M3Q71_01335 [Chloroflexota bacterium]|nr:hypothetical protein [Chloroflexota bacterium]